MTIKKRMKNKSDKCWWGRGQPLCLLAGGCKDAAAAENRQCILRKLNTENHDPAIPLLGKHPEELEAGSWRGIYTHVHNNTIHNSYAVEAIQVFIYSWMDKYGVPTYNGILLIFLKRRILTYTTTWMNLEDTKPVKKARLWILSDTRYLERQIHRGRKQNDGHLSWGRG